jgi:putative membrane protein
MMEFPFPELNASLNGLATVLLTLGFIFIKIKNVRAHQYLMVSAFFISIVFLISYVTHRIIAQGVHTPFSGEGSWRTVYYSILISHIILAIIIVPLVLRTLFLAVTNQFERHRFWARITFPIWYYVSITGVLVYFFLYQWFPSDIQF